MTHLERARATIAKIKNDIIVADNLGAEPTPAIELLVAEFAQVTNEALERAGALVDEAAGEPQSHLGNRIRSLKVSP